MGFVLVLKLNLISRSTQELSNFGGPHLLIPQLFWAPGRGVSGPKPPAGSQPRAPSRSCIVFLSWLRVMSCLVCLGLAVASHAVAGMLHDTGAEADVPAEESCMLHLGTHAKITKALDPQVTFSNKTSLVGQYCYDAQNQSTAAYATFQDVASREVCQEICQVDVNCNFYGWHGSSSALEAPSRCYNCALYKSCEFQRQSVCKDVTPPSNFEKSPADTAAAMVQKDFAADFELNGQFCQRSQIFAAQVANQSVCRNYCQSIAECKIMAFYRDSRVREDAAPDSCNQNCRLYADCDSPVASLCFHPPVLWTVAIPTTTTTTLNAWVDLTGTLDMSAGPAAKFGATLATGPGGKVYLFGGSTDQGPTDEFHYYTWTPAAQLSVVTGLASRPAPRDYHSAVHVRFSDSLLIYGGEDGSRILGDLWEFTWPQNGNPTFTPLTGLSPIGRYAHSAVWTGPRDGSTEGAMLVFGGVTANGKVNEILEWDIATTAWSSVTVSGPAPIPRNTHAAVFAENLGSKGLMLVFGGWDGSGPIADLWAYDLDARTWSQRAARSFKNSASAVWNPTKDAMLVFGGSGNGGFSNELLEWRNDTDEFMPVTAVTSAPAPREKHCAAWVDGEEAMVIFGGWDNSRYADTWLYKP